MHAEYRMYGQRMSYFAAKLRAYMNYKKLDYREKPFSLIDLRFRLPRHTGSHSIPAIETADGEWFSDTTEIIEELDRRHPDPRIVATSPIQKIVSMLLEAWCDDVWYAPVVHTRWSFSDNYPLFREEVGSGLVPILPRPMRNWVVDNTAARFVRGKMVELGIIPNQIAMLEEWTSNMLNLMNSHFEQHDFLLGGRPTIADYGLIGPLYGHLYSDPVSRREMIDTRPNLKAYIDRVHDGDRATGELVAGDQIPETLMPVVSIILSEFFPMLESLVVEVRKLVEKQSLKSGDAIPRFIRTISYSMGRHQYSRVGLSYALWMMQRIKDQFSDLGAADQTAIAAWFERAGGIDFSNFDLGPRVERDGMGVRLAAD